jgi:hypothetical protein
MDLQTFINTQPKIEKTETTKLNLLKSIAELLLTGKQEHFKLVIKHIAILANSYHVPLRKNSQKPEKYGHIENTLLQKAAEIIKNDKGYQKLLPETFNLVLIFAQQKGVKLLF